MEVRFRSRERIFFGSHCFFLGAPAPCGRHRGSTSLRGAGGGMKFRCRRRKRFRHNDLNKLQCFFKPRLANSTRICAAGPALTRGAGALCLVPPFASPGGLAPVLHKPAATLTQRQSHALSCFAASRTALRRFASRASEPFGFLGGSGSLHAPPAAPRQSPSVRR